jgi:uncharacterized protein (DUF1684 family)
MKIFRTTLLLFLITSLLYAQDSIPDDVLEFRAELNRAYSDPEESPLAKEDIPNFKGHEFFDFNDTFRVQAKFITIADPDSFEMNTSSGKLKMYSEYARLEFEIDGKNYELYAYQSHRLRAMDEYKDYLFLPFKDHTNGIESYGGGRYIDLSIPEGETILLDFNQSYNPYCAYRDGYSCPIPPEENHLELKVNAGILKPED